MTEFLDGLVLALAAAAVAAVLWWGSAAHKTFARWGK